jgi:pyruvate dehydrogenase E1 component
VPGAVGVFDALLKAPADREMSTTMAFVRMLGILTEATSRSASASSRSCRTNRAPSAWKACSASSASTRRSASSTTPEDADQLMFYKEDKHGQILQEGINEAGAMSSWIAAATSYATMACPMMPFYIFYSMFGFQRVGDLAWAAGDMRARGFLLGGTAGRTTLAGEGLQHEDGHSHMISSTIPNCVSYDPTFGYELAVIIQDGLRRMYAEQEDVFYYITVMNENYAHPAMPAGAESDILKGMYLLRAEGKGARARACSCWAAARSCAKSSPRPSCSSRTSASRPTSGAARASPSCAATAWKRRAGTSLHPEAAPRVPHIAKCLDKRVGPAVARPTTCDYMRIFAEQVRPYVDRRYTVLGTDGFGRSDTREQLRRFFEVNRFYVVVAALKALADEGAAANPVPDRTGLPPREPARPAIRPGARCPRRRGGGDRAARSGPDRGREEAGARALRG